MINHLHTIYPLFLARMYSIILPKNYTFCPGSTPMISPSNRSQLYSGSLSPRALPNNEISQYFIEVDLIIF
jgi:hypothetical protein